MQIPLFDVAGGVAAYRAEIDAAIGRVLDSGSFVLGSELSAFEGEFAAATQARHAIGVASGTDALLVALEALGVGPGDKVIVPALTFFATVETVVHIGAEPVFADVDPDTLTIDPREVDRVKSGAKVVIPVHLFGHPADAIEGITVLEDACQAHGARARSKMVGSIGAAAAFSFYPTKNLPAAGDGGAITTGDDGIAVKAKLLRHHGQREKDLHDVMGYASRLDEIQAALLRVRLRHLDDEIKARRERASWYADALKGLPVELPVEREWAEHVYHLYVVRLGNRDRVMQKLQERGIGCSPVYRMPVSAQPAVANKASMPVAERECARTLALPIYPSLKHEHVEAIARALKEAIA